MTDTTLLIASLCLLVALGAAVWVRRSVARLQTDLDALGGFEGVHFEIGTQTARRSPAARRPHPG
jgi:hypothetical protein